MPEVRILADDLTGALDAGAPFAAASEPLPVRWPPAAPPECGSFAYDSESRDGGDIRSLIEVLPGPGVAFKKIDSRAARHAVGGAGVPAPRLDHR